MRSDVLNSSSNSYGQQIDKWKFSAKTAAFTAADGFCYLVTDADGCAVTLPAPNVGDRIKIVFGCVTSNNHTVTADATTTLFSGYALMLDADGTAAQCKVFAPDETDDDVITMNGGTTGISGSIELVGLSNKMWQVEAVLYSEGTVATPFS